MSYIKIDVLVALLLSFLVFKKNEVTLPLDQTLI